VEKYLRTSFSGNVRGEDSEEPIAKINLLKLWSKTRAEFPGPSKLGYFVHTCHQCMFRTSLHKVAECLKRGELD